MNPQSSSPYPDSRYADQRKAGFALLRFEPQLEREYRATTAGSQDRRIRIGCALALLLGPGGLALSGEHPDLVPWLLAAALVFAPMLYLFERYARMEFLFRGEILEQALVDPMTGLLNRRAFDVHLDGAWLQAQRTHNAVGVMLIDIDRFKQLNEVGGHAFGDSVLQHVGQVLRSCTKRPMDAAARYGGDKFVAVWYEVDGAWLAKATQEFPSRMAGMTFGEGPAKQAVTISGGAVLARPRPGMSVRDAVNAADLLLYDARRTNPGTVRYEVLEPGTALERSVA